MAIHNKIEQWTNEHKTLFPKLLSLLLGPEKGLARGIVPFLTMN